MELMHQKKASFVKPGKGAIGHAATDEMVRLLVTGVVNCISRDNDGYGREISICTLNGIELNRHLVRRGLAWAFRKYSSDYVKEEDKAKSEGIGIWRFDSLPSWTYRELQWQKATKTLANDCPIKGNISPNGHIYHVPWSPWYDKTHIDTKKGERWFCSEAEAVQAGFRAPIWRYQPSN